jgi:hypothetical protein
MGYPVGLQARTQAQLYDTRAEVEALGGRAHQPGAMELAARDEVEPRSGFGQELEHGEVGAGFGCEAENRILEAAAIQGTREPAVGLEQRAARVGVKGRADLVSDALKIDILRVKPTFLVLKRLQGPALRFFFLGLAEAVGEGLGLGDGVGLGETVGAGTGSGMGASGGAFTPQAATKTMRIK